LSLSVKKGVGCTWGLLRRGGFTSTRPMGASGLRRGQRRDTGVRRALGPAGRGGSPAATSDPYPPLGRGRHRRRVAHGRNNRTHILLEIAGLGNHDSKKNVYGRGKNNHRNCGVCVCELGMKGLGKIQQGDVWPKKLKTMNHGRPWPCQSHRPNPWPTGPSPLWRRGGGRTGDGLLGIDVEGVARRLRGRTPLRLLGRLLLRHVPQSRGTKKVVLQTISRQRWLRWFNVLHFRSSQWLEHKVHHLNVD